MRKKLFFLFAVFLAETLILHAQEDSAHVQILHSEKLNWRNTGGVELEILAGQVKLKQGNTLFYCDSCVINGNGHVFEAFGNVHINDGDTAQVWSNNLRYLYGQKYAYLNGNVRLNDGHGTLTTNNLEYDVARKIGTYKNGGKVVNRQTTVTSREAIYYSDIKDVYFKGNVLMKDPVNTIKTDSILYNTEMRLARFISKTTITDTSGRKIVTTEGTYNELSGVTEFTQRTTIVDKSLTVTGDEIKSNDSTGIIQIRGRGVLIDTAKGIMILANNIFADRKREAFLATQKPLMIVKQEKDSIYIAADTLFSARLSDLFVDTSKNGVKPNPNDSTNRYFEAYRNVRVFSDSVQAVSDSLFYSFKDSIFQLFQDPVVWSRKSQVTGDTIYLHTKNKKPTFIKVIENSFMVTEVQPSVYNQIKSSKMDGFFTDGQLDSVKAKGAAESVYFIQDKDSAFSSVNQTKSDIIDIYFDSGELHKIVLRSSVQGTLYPIKQKEPSQMRLPAFRWLDARRPKTKYELFE
jgi:lipopolysaccharide export system protein LptA